MTSFLSTPRKLSWCSAIRSTSLAIAVFGGVLLAAGPAAADVLYNFVSIDVPSSEWTVAYGISNSGVVVGGADYSWGYNGPGPPEYGFLYQAGSTSTFNGPWGGDTAAYGVNNAGQTIGYSNNWYSCECTAFVGSGGNYTPIGYAGAQNTVPTGINDLGTIVGFFVGGDGQTHGFVDQGGVYSQFDVPGASGTSLYGINDEGAMVGQYDPAGGGGWVSFVDENGVLTTLPGLSIANGINDEGVIVGSIGCCASQQAVVYENGVYTTLAMPGSAIRSGATGINDAGQIVGFYATSDDPYGVHGFVDTPIPEPGALTLLASGCGLLAVIAARRRRI